MALACDYVLAADEAPFVLAFTRIGLMPDGGSTALVTASIGRARALRLAMTGERLDGRTAADWGLVAESVRPDAFAARAEVVLADARGRRHARARRDDGGGQRRLPRRRGCPRPRGRRPVAGSAATDDHLEGVAAFLGKRPAVPRPLTGAVYLSDLGRAVRGRQYLV